MRIQLSKRTQGWLGLLSFLVGLLVLGALARHRMSSRELGASIGFVVGAALFAGPPLVIGCILLNHSQR